MSQRGGKNFQTVVNIWFYVCSKVRLAFENMSQRLKQGQTEGEAANNTGLELTQAAEVCV